MITWTESARATLATHNRSARAGLLAAGADPDEVAGDLQRHIEEELQAAQIHLVTREDVQRVLGRMGAPSAGDEPPPPRPRHRLALALLGLAAALASGAALAWHHRNPPTAEIPDTASDYPHSVSFVSNTPRWGQFQPGDRIVITSVRGDRERFEVGGHYLVEGTYTLASMDSATLSVSITVPTATSPGARSPIPTGESMRVVRGSGRFTLPATLRYPGRFHVSFNPLKGGQSRGTVYFGTTPAPEGPVIDRTEPGASLHLSVAPDATVSVDGRTLADDELVALLAKTHAEAPDTIVSIKAEEAAPLKNLAAVLDSCRQAGITKVDVQSR